MCLYVALTIIAINNLLLRCGGSEKSRLIEDSQTFPCTRIQFECRQLHNYYNTLYRLICLLYTSNDYVSVYSL